MAMGHARCTATTPILGFLSLLLRVSWLLTTEYCLFPPRLVLPSVVENCHSLHPNSGCAPRELTRFAETLQVTDVKVIRQRPSGQHAGYGFVEFASQFEAQNVLNNFNGRPITQHPSVMVRPITFFALSSSPIISWPQACRMQEGCSLVGGLFDGGITRRHAVHPDMACQK
jgi:RNA recognition motif-containing protein